MNDSNQHDRLDARQGLSVDDSDADRLDAALELAFDYRGDVTIVRRDDGASIEGYLYDRKRDDDPARAKIRIIPADGSPRITMPVSDVARIEFTGRDTASGKSFDTWMKRYVEKRLAGERAAIDSEPLEE